MLWEDIAKPGRGAAMPELVRIDGDFYERIAARKPYPIELVCGVCGTVHSGGGKAAA